MLTWIIWICCPQPRFRAQDLHTLLQADTGDSALTNTNVYRYDYNLVPQLYFIVYIVYECDLCKVVGC